MVVLHIAHIKNDPYSGVCVIVPQHIIAQQKHAQVAFLNMCDNPIPGIENQFTYTGKNTIANLPKPFCNPDIVVFHEIYRKQFPGLAKYCLKRNIPYIVFPHGSLVDLAQKIKAWKKIPANMLLFGPFVAKAQAIHCLSQRELEATHFENRKFVCANGISMPEKQKKNFSSCGARFVYIGRTDIYVKGMDIMLEAIAQEQAFLREKGATVKIFGPDRGGSLEQIEELIKEYNVADIVTICGGVTGEAKEKVLLDSDIFIQTSRFEGIPGGILEAMSYGVPCLVTDGTHVEDIVNAYDAGWTAPCSAEHVAKQLRRCMQHPEEWGKKSEGAIAAIQANFLWDTISKETLSHYQEFSRFREGEGQKTI